MFVTLYLGEAGDTSNDHLPSRRKEDRVMSELPSIEEKAVELIEKFEALATDIAPDAIELGLMTARISAANNAILAIVGVAVAVYCLPRGVRWFMTGPDDARHGIPGVANMIAGAVGGIIGLTHLSLWTFIGVFYPELWIAKQVLGW